MRCCAVCPQTNQYYRKRLRQRYRKSLRKGQHSNVRTYVQGVLLPLEIPELAELQQRVSSCKLLSSGARHVLQVAPNQRSTIAQLKILQVRGWGRGILCGHNGKLPSRFLEEWN